MNEIEQSRTRRKWSRLAVLIGLMFGLVFVLSGTSSAMTDDEMAGEIVRSVLSDQGVVLDDDAVRARLEDEVQDAIGIGAVLWSTLNELGFQWAANVDQSSPTSVPASSTTLLPGEVLRERLRDRIREQLRIWDAVAPEWRQAFEELRERLRDCRESEESACWLEFRLRLHYEHALRFQETFEERYRNMQTDGGSISELAELERMRERAQNRIDAIVGNGSSTALDDAGLQLGDLERLQDRLREHAQIHQSTSVPASSLGGSTSTSVSPGSSSPSSVGGPNTSQGGPNTSTDDSGGGSGSGNDDSGSDD